MVTSLGKGLPQAVNLPELNLPGREEAHFKKDQPMPEPGNISPSVSPLFVMNGQFHDAEIQLMCTEEQVKIPKRIEIAEIRALSRDQLVV